MDCFYGKIIYHFYGKMSFLFDFLRLFVEVSQVKSGCLLGKCLPALKPRMPPCTAGSTRERNHFLCFHTNYNDIQ